MGTKQDRYGLIGTLVAEKYQVEGLVGEGGFGVVYRAQHRIWDQPVAIKCFTALSNAPENCRDQLLDLFIQEGKLLSVLSSRSAAIVQARDIGTLTTPTGVWLPYMVLEWLEGHSLEALIKKDSKPLGVERSAAEVFQLLDGPARALALAHSHGVAHRDIKPENFFVVSGSLVPGAVIKVLDFGIAKVMQSQAQTAMQATGSNVTSFTPNYGAPEQFDRIHGATGPWTDVFGMALVYLDVMRGGQSTLGGDTFLQLAFASQNPDRRPTPRNLGIEVSDAIEAVFERALAVKVVDRYANMSLFWASLAEALGVVDFPPMPTADLEADEMDALLNTGVDEGGETSTQRLGGLTNTASGKIHPRSQEPTGGSPQIGQTEVAPGSYTTDVQPGGLTVVSPGSVVDSPRSSRAGLLAGLGGLLAVGGVAAYFAMQPAAEVEPADITPSVDASAESPAQDPDSEQGEPRRAAEADPAAAEPSCPEGMVYHPGGKYFQGTDADSPVLSLARPAHQVEVDAFCLDRREVTVAEYRECSGAGECKRAYRDSFWPQGSMEAREWKSSRKAYSPLCNENHEDRGEHPINCVTWNQAVAYCKRAGKRLPTESEWEFAARGSDGRVYPWGDEVPSAEHLNACGTECSAWQTEAGVSGHGVMYEADDGHPATAAVGSFPKGTTERGLLDMTGNVFEWTDDPFLPYPNREGEPPDAVPDMNRVIRGGAFNSVEPEHTDPALRYPMDASAHSHGIGFRCAAAAKL